MNKNMSSILATSLMMSLMGIKYPFKTRSKDPLDEVDVEEEMKLIRKKESRLSYSQRCTIEYRYDELMKERKQQKHDKKQTKP